MKKYQTMSEKNDGIDCDNVITDIVPETWICNCIEQIWSGVIIYLCFSC